MERKKEVRRYRNDSDILGEAMDIWAKNPKTIIHISTPYGKRDWLKKYFIGPKVSYDIETTRAKSFLGPSYYDTAYVEKRIFDHYTGRAKVRTPFKGTRTVWIAGDEREIKVVDLETSHLANIIEYLRGRAREELYERNSFTSGLSYVKTITVNDIEGWLFENCITYPALREEAKRRMIWDEEKIYTGPKQKLEYVKHDRKLTVEQRLKLLTEIVEEVLAK